MLNPRDTLLNGKYQIVRLIGRGGFGFVYLAQETTLNEQVAIKELVPAMVGNEEVLKRFLAEARATRRLTHERLVRTYDVFRDGTNYYIAMEYMTGGSLHDRLQTQGTLLPGEAAQMAAEVAEGLDYAHRRGVVHCDLKPGNILFDTRGGAKVGDFGVAYVSNQLVDRTWHTSHGFVAGTVAYMSPEQAAGVRDDPRIDLYALGAVLYRALTGHSYLEFKDGFTPAAQAENIVRARTTAAPPPSSHDPRVPSWLDAVVLRSLAKQPDERFATAEEMRQALLRQERLPTAPGTPPARRPQSPALSPAGMLRGLPAKSGTHTDLPRWFWIAAAAAALLFVAIVILVLTSLGGRDDTVPTITQVVIAPDPTDVVLTTAPADLPTLPPTATSPAPPATAPLPTATLPPFLLVEDFEDPNTDWGSLNSESTLVGYEAGEYRVAVYRSQFVAWGNAPAEFSVDYDVEVDARLVEGPVNNNLGLLVRYQLDTDEYYWFQISSDGYYAVDLFVAGEFASLAPWQQSAAIATGAGATNRLRVTCDGANYRFYVNGVHLADVVDDTLSGGTIGVAAGTFDEPGVIVHFDNVAVRALE